MAITRYNQRETFINTSSNYLYSPIFTRRGISAVTQFDMAQLEFPSLDDMVDIEVEGVVWTAGQKYFKLAAEYYGSPEYWWVIAWYNRIPLENDILAGTVINIPTPLESVLEAIGVVF